MDTIKSKANRFFSVGVGSMPLLRPETISPFSLGKKSDISMSLTNIQRNKRQKSICSASPDLAMTTLGARPRPMGLPWEPAPWQPFHTRQNKRRQYISLLLTQSLFYPPPLLPISLLSFSNLDLARQIISLIQLAPLPAYSGGRNRCYGHGTKSIKVSK